MRSSSITRLVVAGGALLAFAIAAPVGCLGKKAVPVPHAGGTPSAACAECHETIYEEWRGSAHASAFTREEFRIATREHAQEDCLRCHVPASLERLSDAPVRTVHRDEGVNCESCHLLGDAYATPKIFTDHGDHKVVQNDLLLTSDFCGECHEAIFKQWSGLSLPDDERKTCQECHMPAVRRKTVSGSVWHLLHPTVDARRHGFKMPQPEPDKPSITLYVAVEHASQSNISGVVTLTNVGAQHSLPSGEYGFRELAVIVALVDRYGVASAKRVERFVVQKRRLIAYREPRELTFSFDAIPRDVEALEVQLVRSSFAGVEAVIHQIRVPLREPPQRGE